MNRMFRFVAKPGTVTTIPWSVVSLRLPQSPGCQLGCRIQQERRHLKDVVSQLLLILV